MLAACNICGGTEFEPGPGGRQSPDGAPPRCSKCGSLERHRALRRAFILIPPPMLAWEYGHYQDYGRDFQQRFEIAERGLSTLVTDVADPVTGDSTYKFCFFCRQRNDAETLAAALAAEEPTSVESFTRVPG